MPRSRRWSPTSPTWRGGRWRGGRRASDGLPPLPRPPLQPARTELRRAAAHRHGGATGTFTYSCPPHQTGCPAEGLLDTPVAPPAAVAALLEGAVLQNNSRASMLAAFLC